MSKNSNRRDFLKTTASAGTIAALPSIVPSYVLGANAPSDKITIGMVGMGWRGFQLMQEAYRNPNIQIAAVCDLDLPYLLHGQGRLDDFMSIDRKLIDGEGSRMVRHQNPGNAVDAYSDYEYMYDRKDLDAVIVAVPDHWHAKLYIDAMDAGKDVYGEKPLSLTIYHGRAIANKAKETERIFQTGTQQRSAPEFLKACEYVQNGRIGKIKHVSVGVGGAPQTAVEPSQSIPAGLNWNKWLGGAPKVPYTPKRCHVTFRWFFDYSGGMVTDWGAHHLDIMQWGLDKNYTGPRFVEGSAETKPGLYTTFTSFNFTFTYADGNKVLFGNNQKGGITFVGEKGQIWVDRGRISCDPEGIFDEPLTSSDKRLYKSDNHMQNWVDCIKSRKLTIANPEIGHRSVTVCHLANICGKLGRKLEWDPDKERFVNDNEANSHIKRYERPPYAI